MRQTSGLGATTSSVVTNRVGSTFGKTCTLKQTGSVKQVPIVEDLAKLRQHLARLSTSADDSLEELPACSQRQESCVAYRGERFSILAMDGRMSMRLSSSAPTARPLRCYSTQFRISLTTWLGCLARLARVA